MARGLKLLERVSLAAGAVRFSELRATLPGVQDPTLARLLQGLEAAGHLRRADAGGYTTGPAWDAWAAALGEAPDEPGKLFERSCADLVRKSNESAGVAVLEGDRLMVASSRTAPGAVSIIEAGRVLHFEPDHAAAMAVLAGVTAKRREELIASPTSRISGAKAFAAARAALKESGGAWIDRSLARPGICRIAAGFAAGEFRGAVFLCLTVERAQQAANALGETVASAAAELERRLEAR